MEVTDVRMETYRWKRPKPIRNGRYVYPTAGLNVIKVDTDEGITGIGLSGGVMEAQEIGRSIAEHLKQYVVGQDPFDTERVWDDMWQPKLVGRRGITTRVMSGIDIALWDIKGKVANRPLYKMLGGFADMVPVYIAGGYYEAIQIARKIEKYDVYWFEEPVNPDDYEGHKLISQATYVPIATGENEYTRYGFRDLIEQRCVAILQPDALVMGGITEFMKVAALAQAHDLPIAPHGNQDVHVHLVSAIPNGLIVEYYGSSFDPMWGKTFNQTLRVEDNCVRPPDRPGIGIDLNEEALAPYRVG